MDPARKPRVLLVYYSQPAFDEQARTFAGGLVEKL